jgi:hypothetical protein
LSARKLMGKRSLVLAATLVLVVSMGLPVIAHGMAHASPGATAATTTTHTGVGASATVQNAAVVAPKAVSSPHPGYLVIHEVTPGGATTEDPSTAYDTVSFEPIVNTYETLVAYNGTTTASFVPVASTCVPSTHGCQVDYGTTDTLVDNGTATAPLGGALNGQPVYWTFPIDPNAMFYDPNTTNSWHLTPTDVAFTVARTMSYSDLPFVASQNGWIAAQTLLPFGNPAYDVNGTVGGPVHFPFNNTPFNVMSSMLINNTTYCPATALAAAGCITFVADGGGQDWPFFLQIVADALGTGIESCGVFTHNGAILPGFVGSLAPNGDGGCLLPGGAHSTSDAAFQTWLSDPTKGSNDTYWDAEEIAALNAPAIEAFPRYNLVGTGPYYASVSLSAGYTLKVNPAYAQPIGCSGGMAYTYTGYCDPAPGHYLHQVNVTYDLTDSNSISGFSSGTIDAGGIFPSHTVTNLLPLKNAGKLQVITSHTLSNFFYGYNTVWNSTVFASDFPSEPAPNIPSDFFTSTSARNFFTTSYPFVNVQNQLLTVGGIQYGFDNVCGPIPLGMGDYFPTNLSACPNGNNPDPNSADVGGAAWWFAQATNPASPYYDAEIAACQIHQCTLPIVGEVGAQTLDSGIQQWINEIYTLSGHAIKPYEFDLTFTQLIVEVLFSSAGQNPVPIWNLGWAPDYPDPTDYMAPYAIPEGTYTVPDAVDSSYTAQNNASNAIACTHATGSLSDMYYWAYNAATAQIPTKCEGYAWQAAQAGINAAAPLGDTPTRVLYYNAAEQILSKLSLYVWFEQQNGVGTIAPWIDASTVNTNPTLGGGGDQPFFHWGYNPPNVVTFKELKLPIASTWSVTMNGGPLTSNLTYQVGSTSAGTLVFHVPNGTQNFIITAPSGFGVAKISGIGVANQSAGSVTGGASVTWTVTFGAIQPIEFYELNSTGKYMYFGAPWSVYLNGSNAFGPAGQFASGTGQMLTFYEPGGASLKFQILAPSIYKIAPGHGGVGVPTTHGVNKLIKFILLIDVVHFHETGLSGVYTWAVNITGDSGASAAWFSTFFPSGDNLTASVATITVKLPVGVYSWTAFPVGVKNPTPASGVLTVSAAPAPSQTVTIAYA